jgi:hypothetical protein
MGLEIIKQKGVNASLLLRCIYVYASMQQSPSCEAFENKTRNITQDEGTQLTISNTHVRIGGPIY